MTVSVRSSVRRIRDRRASLLGWALLLTIGFGATIGLVHGHESGAPRPASGQAASVKDLPPSSETGDTQSTNCPLCQFHHQLFNGVGEAPIQVFAPALEYQISSPVSVIPSLSFTPRTLGRAPPAATV